MHFPPWVTWRTLEPWAWLVSIGFIVVGLIWFFWPTHSWGGEVELSANTNRAPERSTFEARTGGEISARDALIPPNLPFTLGRAETGGKIVMDGARFVLADETPHDLQIVFGSGEQYESKKVCGLYKTTHTFIIGVKNASKTRFLSNCKLYLDIQSTTGDSPKSYLLVDTFTLAATEERYVPIASYDEPATISNYAGQHIRLHVPVHAGFLDVGSGWPWQMPIGAYVFTLRATSKEAGSREVACKIWVDEQRKLHFETA
jgi:hypothetical protein